MGVPPSQGTTKPRSAVSVRNVGQPAPLPGVTSWCWSWWAACRVREMGKGRGLTLIPGAGTLAATWFLQGPG